MLHLFGTGDGQADAQVIDRQLQEESTEGLNTALLDSWQFVNHLFSGHVDIWV